MRNFPTRRSIVQSLQVVFIRTSLTLPLTDNRRKRSSLRVIRLPHTCLVSKLAISSTKQIIRVRVYLFDNVLCTLMIPRTYPRTQTVTRLGQCHAGQCFVEQKSRCELLGKTIFRLTRRDVTRKRSGNKPLISSSSTNLISQSSLNAHCSGISSGTTITSG